MAAPRKSALALKAAAKKKAKAQPHRVCAKPLDPVRIEGILRGLANAYPDAQCALHHKNAWQLLVATILSAQCTDVRVNLVTPELFKKYPTAADFAALTPEALESDIRSTGFYRNKAKSITAAARRVIAEYGGKVPDTMEDLLTLPGVARKTANVVLGVWFRKAEGIVVDTHVQRISQRLQLTKNTAPEKIEQDLEKILPRDQWIAFSHRIIHHGRQVCIARKPKCEACTIEKLCCSGDKTYWSSDQT